MKKFLRISGVIILAILIFGLAAFLIWAETAPEPENKALQSLDATLKVDFEEANNWFVYTPAEANPTTGLILYPGGRVDARAYAPLAQSIAGSGFRVVIVPMPLNFAFFGVSRAAQVMEAYPEIQNWAVGGHSLGGAMAASYVKNNPGKIAGLVLWASYPSEGTDLSGFELDVLSIYGTNDGLASPQEVLSSRARLPLETDFVEIRGGNHAGFGWYGPQSGDGETEILKTEQQAQVVTATARFLSELGK